MTYCTYREHSGEVSTGLKAWKKSNTTDLNMSSDLRWYLMDHIGSICMINIWGLGCSDKLLFVKLQIITGIGLFQTSKPNIQARLCHAQTWGCSGYGYVLKVCAAAHNGCTKGTLVGPGYRQEFIIGPVMYSSIQAKNPYRYWNYNRWKWNWLMIGP